MQSYFGDYLGKVMGFLSRLDAEEEYALPGLETVVGQHLVGISRRELDYKLLNDWSAGWAQFSGVFAVAVSPFKGLREPAQKLILGHTWELRRGTIGGWLELGFVETTGGNFR